MILIGVPAVTEDSLFREHTFRRHPKITIKRKMASASCLIGCLILLASLSQVSGLCSTCVEELCHDNGECIIGCVAGFVGEYCDEACPPRCLNKACHIHIVSGVIACTDGCEPGYCDIKCEVQCPGDCVTCDRQCDSCNVTPCQERRFGTKCSEICSPRYDKCDRESGQCIRCRRGFFGDECKQECTGCFTRADNIYDTCLSGCKICQAEEICPVGFYGDICEIRCSTGCENLRRCNRATGECSNGCVSGYYGLACHYTCSEHCLSGRCNRATGECSAGCLTGYHGPTCNYTCSEHCLSGRCNRETGECTYGCVSGYHGLICNHTCNNLCEGGVCNQGDGVCTSRCISGYTHNLDICEKYDNEGSHTPVAIAAPIILVCLLAGMVTAALIWRRRRSRRPNRPKTEHAEKSTDGNDVVAPLLKYKKGRAMILNSERVHRELQVEDFGRVLTNLERSGDRKSPGQFSKFWGTCSNPVPVPASPSPLTTPPSYWETSSTLTWRERGWTLLEMGLVHGRSNMDVGWRVSVLPNSVCVSVTDVCDDHPDRLCVQVRRADQEDRRGHQFDECVSLSLPTPGVEFTLTFGLVLDVGRGRVGFIDVERGQLLCKVDLQMKEEVSPMFCVDPVNNFCATRMRLISGREICVTDRKIHLIQQALSD